MTAAQALERHGVEWKQLERVAGKALQDAMRARGIHLDEYRLDRAHFFFLEKAVRWLGEYDAELAGGASPTTSVYRRLCPRREPAATLIDFLRREHGDDRRGVPIHLVPAGERHEISDAGDVDVETFEQLVEHVAGGLTLRARETLTTIAYEALVLGLERWRIAKRHSIEPTLVSELLEELGWQLRRTVTA